jgi:methylase of polypeptide subunit release factors
VRAPPRRTAVFGGMRILYDPRVLEPRGWTALQSHWAAELSGTAPPGPILELCAGVGQIGLVAAVTSGRRLVQVDADPLACEMAVANAREAGLSGVVDVRCGDLEAMVGPGERFPLIIADPPYVPSALLDRYPDDPPLAIDGGPDGLDVVRRCVRVVGTALDPHGAALVQVLGEPQATALSAELPEELELVEVRSHDRERAVALLRRTSSDPSQEHADP